MPPADIREINLIESGIFLILGISVQRTIIRGTPTQLRKAILRNTLRPLLILGLHLAWPIVASVHATVFLGTFLKPTGWVRKLIMIVFGTTAVCVSVALTALAIGLVVVAVNTWF